MKIIRLYLLGYKGLRVLNALDEDELRLIKDVVIAKDDALINDYFEEIKHFCISHNLTFYNRNSEIKSNCDYLIAIGWRWLIKESNKIIVIHDSILPRLRGFNPLVTALINGDNEIGATALLAVEEFDKGPIIAQKTKTIHYPLKIKEAIEIVSEIYVDLVKTIISKIQTNTLNLLNQNEDKSTYSVWRDEEDYWINWELDSLVIKRFIDAVGFPYTGAKTSINGKTLTIFDAEIIPDVKIENRTPGKVIFKDENGLTIICGSGLIKVKDFYLDEKNKFDYSNLFRLKFK